MGEAGRPPGGAVTQDMKSGNQPGLAKGWFPKRLGHQGDNAGVAVPAPGGLNHEHRVCIPVDAALFPDTVAQELGQ